MVRWFVLSPPKPYTLTCLFLDSEYDPAQFKDAVPINNRLCLILLL